MDRNLRLVLLREIPEAADLRLKWNALVARLDQPQVFYTYEWALAVQRAYHDTLQTLLFLAYDEQESLTGVVALAADNAGRVTFLCATTGDYCDFLSEPVQKPEFAKSVLEELKRQGVGDITLTNLPADSDTVAALGQMSARNRYHCFMRTAYECAQVVFSQLERGKDGRPLAPGKKRVRRFAKAMAAEGDVRFDHSRSWNAVEPILPEFIRAHVVRFLEIGRISNLADARRREFLIELSKLLSESHWLVLSRMGVGEKIYAWHYGFQFHDNWFWYQPTFDSSAEKYWPGFCLLTQVIQEATENPMLTKLDLGLGAEAYKAKFANATRRTLYLTLRRSRLKHWKEIMRYRVVTAVATRPAAERAVRDFIAKAGALKQRLRKLGLRQTCFWIARRAESLIAARDEVVFYELTNPTPALLHSDGVFLKAIDFETLATAAMQNAKDDDTLAYLLRCAKRLRTDSGAVGYALVNPDGRILHFAWTTDFDGFYLSELNTKVAAPAANCVMLFDCWTPHAVRGHGHYGRAAGLVADRMREEGKWPWIFSATSNVPSIKGLERAGFERRYSLVRQRVVGWQRIKGETPRLDMTSHPEVSAHV